MLGDDIHVSQVVVRHKWDECNTQDNTSVWEAEDGVAASRRDLNGYIYQWIKILLGYEYNEF